MRAVVLTLHQPWQRSHGGTLRTRAIVEALVALGHDVACVHPGPEGPAPEGVTDVGTGDVPLGQQPWSASLRAVKRRYVPMPTGLGSRDRRLSRALAGLGPVDLLVVGEMAGVRYRAAAGGARIWIDFPDVLSAAAALHASSQPAVARRTALAQAGVLERAERQAVGGADVVTAAGWGDARLLGSRARRRVAWLPTPVEVVPRPASPPPRTAGFFANFAHLPNLDAYDVLGRTWAPRLRELGWEVVVAGHHSGDLPRCDHVARLGPVPSPAAFYDRVGLSLAPVRLGGGMKVKVVESLAHGRPVIAAPHVLDGFPPDLRRHIGVVDVDRPDFTALGTPVSPEVTAVLERFGRDRFVDSVGGALQRLAVCPRA